MAIVLTDIKYQYSPQVVPECWVTSDGKELEDAATDGRPSQGKVLYIHHTLAHWNSISRLLVKKILCRYNTLSKLLNLVFT